MTRTRRSARVAALAVGVVAIVVGLATPASAHASFAGPSSYPSSTDQRLTLDVPHERGDGPNNVKVEVFLPADWRANGCESAAPWHCSVETSDGRPVVRWTKDAGAGPTASDEQFVFNARTGAPGRATFPVVQTYSTGETVRWIGPPDSDEPAPYLDITAAPSSTAPPQTTSPPTTVAGTTSTTARASGSTTTTAAGAGGATTTTTTDPSDLDATQRRSGNPDDGGSGGALLWLVLAVVVAALAAATFAFRDRLPWRRRPSE
jgi:uncharacterized protein YcnI